MHDIIGSSSHTLIEYSRHFRGHYWETPLNSVASCFLQYSNFLLDFNISNSGMCRFHIQQKKYLSETLYFFSVDIKSHHQAQF
jgi:hypothetical protein